MSFQFKKLQIPDVLYVQTDVFKDERGFFAEMYRYSQFKEMGIDKHFLQVNHSKSAKNVLRGLHFQLNPKAQAKFVSVIEGEVFDVALDIRVDSPTYGKWVAEILSADKKNMLYIPEGFAHGFCTLSQTAQFVYYCTEEYSPEHERGIMWNDPIVNIQWPVKNPIISGKDKIYLGLDQTENNFKYDQ